MKNGKNDDQLNFEDEYRLYGGTPPHSDDDTSLEAAEAIEGSVGRLQRLVLDTIIREGGLTCDDVEIHTSLRHQTASARIRELVILGRIEPSGEKKKTRSGRRANIYIAVP